MECHQKYRLIYFNRYSDFSFQIDDDFIVTVHENEYNMTEVFAEYNEVLRKIIVFQQCALAIFREVSPNHFIEKYSEYMKILYQQECCIICDNMTELI